jgi:hypothetical protein
MEFFGGRNDYAKRINRSAPAALAANIPASAVASR